MAKHGEVVWNQRQLVLQVRDLSIAEIDKLALQIITVSDPPIDTGYLNASAYVNSSSGLNTFDETWSPGEYINRDGQLVPRDSINAPQEPPADGAVAGWAADYTAFVEENTSFIYNAVRQVAQRQGND